MRLTIEKMAQGGRGLARLPDGRICFVDGALPGEQVDVDILRSKKDFVEAQVVSVDVGHAGRVKPACPYYAQCGGCNLQHASMELQIHLMRQVVDELFARFAKTTLPSAWPIVSGEPWGYRNRARFMWSGRAWGFRARASHQIVPIDKCPVLSPALNAFLRKPPTDIRAREIDVFDNGAGTVAYWHPHLRSMETARALVPLLGKQVSMDASVFFQSNLSMLPRLVEAVLAAAGTGRHAVDLFSGVGLFSLFLQDRFERVSAVEREVGCLEHARHHLGERCHFVAEPAEVWLAEQGRLSGVDCLVVDPPRTGLPPSVCAAIGASRAQRLVYVSCDPVTLARDTRILLDSGYTLQAAQGFAFYPQTSHFEMLAVFVRTEPVVPEDSADQQYTPCTAR